MFYCQKIVNIPQHGAHETCAKRETGLEPSLVLETEFVIEMKFAVVAIIIRNDTITNVQPMICII